jgi:hypothetical protein
MNALLAGPLLAIWLLPPGVAAVWLLVELAIPPSEDPALTTSGARWRLQHVSRTAAACAVYALWLAGLLALTVAIGWGASAPLRLLALAGAMSALGSSLLVPLLASRCHAVVRADPLGLVAERPWPFRTRRWSWVEIDTVTSGPGQLVIATHRGQRTPLTGFGSTQSQFERVARWLDQRAAIQEPAPRHVPPELIRAREAARWVRQ